MLCPYAIEVAPRMVGSPPVLAVPFSEFRSYAERIYTVGAQHAVPTGFNRSKHCTWERRGRAQHAVPLHYRGGTAYSPLSSCIGRPILGVPLIRRAHWYRRGTQGRTRIVSQTASSNRQLTTDNIEHTTGTAQFPSRCILYTGGQCGNITLASFFDRP